jgi:hypothetical protein
MGSGTIQTDALLVMSQTNTHSAAEQTDLTLTTEGILRKLQKVMKLTQKWKEFENNGTT